MMRRAHDSPTAPVAKTARVPPIEDLHLLGALVGGAALAMAWAYPLWRPAWEVFCPLKELTGVPCPTCYGTRALLAAVHGHWLVALRLNPLIGVAGIATILYVPVAVVSAVKDWPRWEARLLESRRFAWLVMALAALNWIYLILS